MYGYNNHSIKLSSYNSHIPLYAKNMQYTRPSEVDRAWPAMARIAARAIFGPIDILK